MFQSKHCSQLNLWGQAKLTQPITLRKGRKGRRTTSLTFYNPRQPPYTLYLLPTSVMTLGVCLDGLLQVTNWSTEKWCDLIDIAPWLYSCVFSERSGKYWHALLDFCSGWKYIIQFPNCQALRQISHHLADQVLHILVVPLKSGQQYLYFLRFSGPEAHWQWPLLVTEDDALVS